MQNPTPFEVLGLDPETSSEELKLAWRRLASEHHPDKGGDATKFHSLRQSYNEALKLAVVNDKLSKMCLTCNGVGKIDNPRQLGFYATFKIMCPSCMGSGKRR